MTHYPMRQPRVCISLLNWNSPEDTIRCVVLLREQAYSNVEIVVVDNASQDGSADRIRSAFPDLTLLRAEENLGYAAGHQLAVDYALRGGFDLIWLLNTDLHFVDDRVLSALVDAYLTHGDALYGSIEMRAEDASLIARDYYAVAHDPNQANPLDVHGIPLGPVVFHSNKLLESQSAALIPQRVTWVSGFSFMVPMSVIREHGFMDDCFFLYAEEVEYCVRLARRGLCSYIVPGSRVAHVNQGTSKENSRLSSITRYYRTRNQLILYKRLQGPYRYLRKVLRTKHAKLLIKVFVRSLFDLNDTEPFLLEYMKYLALRDSFFNRMGKTIAPEDFLAGRS